MIRIVQFIIALIICALPVCAQTTARSHVERFSTPEARAERVEAESSARLAQHPNDTEALNMRAPARMRFGRYQEAYEDLRRVVSLKPDNSAYRANFGYALWKLGRAEEAITAERLALKLDDKNFTAYYQLGRFLLRVGGKERLTESAVHLRRALRLNAGAAEAHTLLGVILASRGNANLEASEVLSQAIALNPKSFDAHFYLGRVLYTVKELRGAIDLNPRHAEGRFFFGTALESAGESQAALAEFKRLEAMEKQAQQERLLDDKLRTQQMLGQPQQ